MASRKEQKLKHFFSEKGQHETEKTLKKVRREMKNNRKTKSTRRQQWRIPELEDVEAIPDERIVPRGERERRKAVQIEALAELELAEPDDDIDAPDASDPNTAGDWEEGVVFETSSGFCRVNLDGSHTSLVCTFRGALTVIDTGFTNVVAVGDRVLVSVNGREQGVIETILPRRSALVRPEVWRGHKQQLIAANVDQLLIVAAWRNPHIWLELIDRYLIAAQRNNLAPIICINKTDLADDTAACREELAPYLNLGYQVIFTSAMRGAGLTQLQSLLHNRTTVLAGLSGVGKSSLLAAVEPGLTVRVGDVNDETSQGRHTTTQARWHPLVMGGAVVDTPGIREFGLANLRPTELAQFYPEMEQPSRYCRFGNCTHTHEPDCAVIDAVEQGLIAAVRHSNYCKIFNTLGQF